MFAVAPARQVIKVRTYRWALNDGHSRSQKTFVGERWRRDGGENLYLAAAGMKEQMPGIKPDAGINPGWTLASSRLQELGVVETQLECRFCWEIAPNTLQGLSCEDSHFAGIKL